MPFITLEGIEGSGKSTQARLLVSRLGPDTVLTHEPGGTSLGQSIRGLLLDPARGVVAPETELLLFFADRAQHVREVIRPALAMGRTVVCDRYNDSTIAYQGYGRGLLLEGVRQAAELATGGLEPDLTLWIDVPVAVGLARVGKRGASDRLEAEVEAFHERVRQGYQALAERSPARFLRVDGGGSADAVASRVAAIVAARGWERARAVR